MMTLPSPRRPTGLTRSSLLVAPVLAMCYVLGGVAAFATARGSVFGDIVADGSTGSAAGIFVHNLGVLGWMGSALVTLGLTAGATMLINGMMLGWIVGKLSLAGHVSLLWTAVMPHAIPELAAYLIGGSVSTVMGLRLLAARRAGRSSADLPWRTWWQAQGVAVLLLVFAAVIETTVSHV